MLIHHGTMFLEYLYLTAFFFFSSRRRHTRLQGDWSSDVCSSDLQDLLDAARRVFAEKGFHDAKVGDIAQKAGVAKGRSEERRVGKSVEIGGGRGRAKKKDKRKKKWRHRQRISRL